MLKEVLADIKKIALESKRDPADIKLLAVSKYADFSKMLDLYNQGQRDFGENIVKAALDKKHEFEKNNINDITWHFIAPIQSNKTSNIATNFAWVHSLDRVKIARRLNDHRPVNISPLNICIQVNIDHDPNKSGVNIDDPAQIMDLVSQVLVLPNLKLRGLMTLPAKLDNEAENLAHAKEVFASCHKLFEILKTNMPDDDARFFDTLSMGMSADYPEAIKSGANIVRVGSKLFA